MNRYTFVLYAYPDGLSLLENLSTHERVRIGNLALVGPQIERWLANLPGPEEPLIAPSVAAIPQVSGARIDGGGRERRLDEGGRINEKYGGFHDHPPGAAARSRPLTPGAERRRFFFG
jgi:hypothetical protein